jgi:uncharacterized damage-inducible protein DinB
VDTSQAKGRDSHVAAPGDTDAADIVGPTGEEMPRQAHDGLDDDDPGSSGGGPSTDVIDRLLAELEREAERSRRALERVPDGKHDWKPHDRSMIFGYLANMVATMPTWVAMMITKDELDIAPKDGPKWERPAMQTSAEYLAALAKSFDEATKVLRGTTEAHLETRWRLLAGGEVVSDKTRYEMIRDTINHWVHHRGQMTVYLRLMGAQVPALYGPSADDTRYD